MTTEIKTPMVHINTASIQAHDHQIRNTASQVGRFSLHFLEMLVAMMAGMPILSLVRNLIPASSSFAAAFKSGTILYDLAMAVFMTVPMVAWMILRGHGRRHSAEMGFAMFAPMAAISVLRLLGADAYLPWLVKASHPAMFLGMIIAMLYRRAEYTTGHASHHHAGSPQTEATDHAAHVGGEPMRSNLSIKGVGLSVSAVLAVIYMLVMFASLLLVGLGTSRSLQATLLGIRWSTVVGFEIGLLGVVIVGFVIAVVFVPVYNSVRRRVTSQSKTPARPSQSGDPLSRTWAFRLLITLLVLLPLILFVLHALAPIMSSGVTPGATGINAQGPGVQTQAVNMGPTINTMYREAEPSFTADGRTMYFNCNNGDICVSHLVGAWEEGSWTPPELVGAPISTEYEEVEPVINATGDKLYFTSIRPGSRLWGIPFLSPFINVFRVGNSLATAKLGRVFGGGLGLSDVYVSYWRNGAWSEPQNLNDVASEPHINTPFEDHCLFFSADGNEAFWTSTRPGGMGSNDIWTSRRVGGQWTEPENLGPNVNSSGSEHTAIPTPDGRSLYVTSDRPGGFGGEDIYVTTRSADGTWGPLVNLGPLVNGPGDDRCPAWTPDLKIFLFDSVRQGGFGGRDIWWVYFKDVPGHPLAAASAGSGRLSAMAR